MEDLYRNPGPLQFQGPGADSRPVTLQLEGVNYFSKIAALEKNIDKVLYCAVLTPRVHR